MISKGVRISEGVRIGEDVRISKGVRISEGVISKGVSVRKVLEKKESPPHGVSTHRGGPDIY